MQTSAQPEHRWLQQLVGRWTYGNAPGQDGPPCEGSETVRAIGELWVQCEGHGSMPDGQPAVTVMTLGYDPRRGRFVGSWVGSMMSHQWVYDGCLDAERRVLTLETEGPACTADGELDPGGRTARYRDVIELRGADERVLSSFMRGDDGEWTSIMTMVYRRQST